MKKTPLILSTLVVSIFVFFLFSSNTDKQVVLEKAADNLIENPENNLYWGDTHLHTSNSSDAYAYSGRLDFDGAYRFAKGEEVEIEGNKAKIGTPLDFLVIADHAEGFGIINELKRSNPELTKYELFARWSRMLNGTKEEGEMAGKEMPEALDKGTLPPVIKDPKVIGPITRQIWHQYLDIADKHYVPGKFTTLAGFEWSSMPNGNNLHRVVIFRDNKDKTGQMLPYSSLQSNDAEDLWNYLKKYEEKTGGKVLAIPHNANMSNGRMFAMTNFKGEEMTQDYASRRANWEPLTEVTQTKGQSESHPTLSPNDEFAAQDINSWDDANMTFSEMKNSSMLEFEYARAALKNGLLLKNKLGINPFKFGMIGSTDSHTGMSSAEDDNFYGKFGTQSFDKERAGKNYWKKEGRPDLKRVGYEYNASGYAAVWAKTNSRTDIWDAMKRREVYGTTGSRMQVRFFGGWDFSKNDIEKADYVKIGYKKGVPMGSDLASASNKKPSFMIHAAKDPKGGNLDRIQVVKGWTKDGKTFEKIYDVAWAGKRKLDKKGKLPSVGNTIDYKTATYKNTIGATELATVWTDPEFDPTVEAFYYVRVLEIPTPHWSVYDAVRYGVEHPKEAPKINIEKAYTSPIWYSLTK